MPPLALFPSLAFASPEMLQPAQASIYGGEVVNACEWPSAVHLSDGGDTCTGTLIHPEVVLTAAHCVQGLVTAAPEIRFGEDASNAARTVDTVSCSVHPDYTGLGQGTDLAVCRLAEAVNDVPIVPLLAGCEADALELGAMVHLVGFGITETEPSGVKRHVELPVTGMQELPPLDPMDPVTPIDGEFWLGGNGVSGCSGDSGGPTFIQLDDGQWRVFGVSSWTRAGQGGVSMCETGISVIGAHLKLEWIEAVAGVDVTPCTNPDASWQPTPACADFPLEAHQAASTWAQGCAGGAVAQVVETCGAAPENDDTIAPDVSITDPADGTRFDSVDGLAQVDVGALASDVGFGVAGVRLQIDGADATNVDTVAPYTWSLSVPPGGYVFVAVAVDHAGNEAFSDEVRIGVDQDPPEPPTGESSESGEGGETSDTGEVGTTGDPGSDEASGCACAASPVRKGGWLWGLPLLGGLVWRRRRPTAG